MSDEPIAWKVSCLKPQTYSTNAPPVVEESQSASKEDAEKYRDEMKAQGWIATVTPVFLSPQKRGAARVKTQQRVAPKGWNKDWRLHGDRGVGE